MAAPKLIDTTYDGPQKIDRYDLVAEIASGGMATVFLARLAGVGGFRRFVAVKRLHPHLAQEDEFVQMFLDEARLAAGIHHPNVVPILEVGASERGYYLVMEYIEGDTLARLLARAATSGSRLPPHIGTRIVIDMLSGLHAAHELRDDQGNPTELVHRDVSPQNVLVGMDGNTRITDFGVARAASRLSATRAGQLKGKIAYMAPEQAVGDPTVDRRADVFSSGIVLWEVLAARRLFKAENEAATLSRVISEPIPDIREINPEIDPALAEVVMKALERDRDVRYGTCAEFADDLERVAQEAGVVAAARDVAAYISDVIGNEISQQREVVRAWLARSEPSQAHPDGDAAERSSAVPPLPNQTGDQSGMVAAPVSAPLGEPPVETGSRSKTPLVVGIAALLGFVGVGAVVMLLGQKEPATEGEAAAPPAAPAENPTVPAATAAKGAEKTQAEKEAKAGNAAEPTLSEEQDEVAGGGGTEKQTKQQRAAAEAKAEDETDEAEKSESGEEAKAEKKASRRAARPRRRYRRRAAPSKPAESKDEKPEETESSSGSGVDLSNPYR